MNDSICMSAYKLVEQGKKHKRASQNIGGCGPMGQDAVSQALNSAANRQEKRSRKSRKILKYGLK